MAPSEVVTRTLLDGSISLQFQGYHAIPQALPISTGNDDVKEVPAEELIAMMHIQTDTVRFQFLKIHPEATGPLRKTPGAAGYDLSICDNTQIPAGSRSLLSTGLIMAIPNGYYGRIAPRSGISWRKGIHIGAGVVDSDFRDEVKILVFNMTTNTIFLSQGEAVAQLILEHIITPFPQQVFSLEALGETTRPSEGFGSTDACPSTSDACPSSYPYVPISPHIGTLQWEALMDKLIPISKARVGETTADPVDLYHMRYLRKRLEEAEADEEYTQSLLRNISPEHILTLTSSTDEWVNPFATTEKIDMASLASDSDGYYSAADNFVDEQIFMQTTGLQEDCLMDYPEIRP